MPRPWAAGAIGLVAVAGLMACSGEDAEDGPVVAGAVGEAGSTCPLPVVFDRAKGWAPEKLEPLEDASDPAVEEMLVTLSSPGPFSVACELESPINLGFLRVYTGPAKLAARDPEALLRTFAKELEEGKELTFSTYEADDGLVVTEVSYLELDALLDEEKPRRAFLVALEDGVVVVHLGGLDAEEHEGMLPAYELARQTVRVAD